MLRTTICTALAVVSGFSACLAQPVNNERPAATTAYAAAAGGTGGHAIDSDTSRQTGEAEPNTIKIERSIIEWLAENFQLPKSRDLPRIGRASPGKLVAMRYGSLLPNRREEIPEDPGMRAAQHDDVVAVYDDESRTIFLPENWTGRSVAEQSILVHEMVHHLQNLANTEHECPAAREKLAYRAQARWLTLHGRSMETEFGIDMLTLLVRSTCTF